MKKLYITRHEVFDESIHLKYLKLKVNKGSYTVSLNDLSGYDIVRGYGNTIIEAINDMHRSLI